MTIDSYFPTLFRAPLKPDLPGTGFEVVLLPKPNEEFDNFEIRAASYPDLKRETGAEKIFRLSVFITDKQKLLFLAPAGPDESESIKDLMFCVLEGLFILEKLEIVPEIGIISGGREGDAGRNARVDQTLLDAKTLQSLLDKENISSQNYTILIEDAVKKANFLIIPDSLSGELILRTVAGIGEGREIGNILLFKRPAQTKSLASKTIYIEQLTEKANPKDAEILKQALLSANLGNND
ncbi:hypothetical protein [Methanolapillus ohkumae]|uniref:Uncharacterized protein n=1 Tax=Methanolapillus ohkumae TaxID=3028298 RepID=A0AA96V7F8_9EURY|nr:hypothetical protein MsAm2_07990 [Methanosarcinaceae archaeon Am2]